MKQKDVDKIDKKIIGDYLVPITVSFFVSALINGLILLAIR